MRTYGASRIVSGVGLTGISREVKSGDGGEGSGEGLVGGGVGIIHKACDHVLALCPALAVPKENVSGDDAIGLAELRVRVEIADPGFVVRREDGQVAV